MTQTETFSSTETYPLWRSAVTGIERAQGRISMEEMVTKVKALLRGRYETTAAGLVRESLSKIASELAATGYISQYSLKREGMKRVYLSYPEAYPILLRGILEVINEKTKFPFKYSDSRRRIQDVLGIPHVEPKAQVRKAPQEIKTPAAPVSERTIDQIGSMFSRVLNYGGSASLVKKIITELGITDETPGVTVVGEGRRYSIEIQIRIAEAVKLRPRIRTANAGLDKKIDNLIATRLRPYLSQATEDEVL